MSEVWTNDDGLTIKFGTAEAVFRNIGAYSQDGPVHWVEVLVDHSELPAVADNAVILNDNFAIPAGAIIEGVEIRVPTEAFTGTGATFCLGTANKDGTGIDTDALIDEATLTELNAGGTNDSGWATSNTLEGVSPRVPLAAPKLLTWEVNTAALTAGKTVIRVFWSVEPKNAVDTLVWNKSA